MFEISQLRSFIAVASELHFGRAAVRLHITQPPLSRQVQALEDALGVKLFTRTSRSVQLTTAGRAFLQEARRLMEQAESAMVVARRAADIDSGLLTIGLIGAATYHVLPRVVAIARRSLPHIELAFRELSTAEQLDALALHQIDIGLGRLPAGARGVVTRRISREPLVLAAPHDHPLALSSQLRLQDLGDHPFIAYEPDPGGVIHGLLEAAFAQAHFSPNVVQRIRLTQTALSLVSVGIGVALVPQTAQHACFANVVFRSMIIDTNPKLDMHAFWREDSVNPVLPSFRDLLIADGESA
ncbi:MAG: LysR substrate-binding domain-containing protein [Rhodopila sp.]|nr:LysR substrate-binding domain-containing protein [Rhodopila sp.]